MESKNVQVQAQVLCELCASGKPATVFLKNGYRMDGKVLDFDDTVILLDADGKQKMVYKHMISTIVCEADVM